jgi:hypothetical protein
MRRKTVFACALAGTALAGLLINSAAPAAESKSEVVTLRLLSESEYRHSIADIFGTDILVQGRFEPGRRVGGLLAASGTLLSVTSAGLEAFAKMAESIADQAVDPKNRKAFSCAPRDAKAADSKCTAELLQQYGLMLFRRPLTQQELKSRVALADRLADSAHDFYAGLRQGLVTLLAAPPFLFRTERAIPAGKAYTLDGYSRAARLSYLLWDTTPDAQLLQAAASGALDRPEGVAGQVDRLMASPRLETGMRAFFADFLQLDTFGDTTKDTLIYPKYSNQIGQMAQEETLRTAIDLTLRKNDDVRDLMTTRDTFISRPLASIYGVPFTFDSEWMPYEFSEKAGRSGLLTQITTLGMFSHPGRSSPTKRGVAVMDIFLCEPTPLPPANVDFSIVNDVNNPNLRTVRQRLSAHATSPACASCHSHSDPIGLSLEQFDSIGVHRAKENGQPIDVSATLSGKKFDGAAGLGQVLHDNPKFTSCVARKLYSYGVGTDSEAVEASAFKGAYKSFVDSGYRLRPLLKALAVSPEFFSVPAPAPEETRTASNDAK